MKCYVYLSSLCLVILTACSTLFDSNVPSNTIKIQDPNGRLYQVDAPKNVDIFKFSAAVESNGQFKVSFDRWTSKNDANVISKSSAGKVAEYQALGGMLEKFGTAGGNAAGAAANKSVGF